jgi:hypothetical protein
MWRKWKSAYVCVYWELDDANASQRECALLLMLLKEGYSHETIAKLTAIPIDRIQDCKSKVKLRIRID